MSSLFSIGAVLQGRYELRGELGRGGFARVFRAYDQHLRRQVAIKILEGLEATRSQERYQRLLERFHAEAVASSRLDHPGIITVHDSGVVGDPPQPFMVMELLKGHDLDKELRENGPMPPERAWPLLLGALDALGSAHQQGVVHKDLKPSNLFLLDPGGRKERLKVVDFGIAHICEQDERLTGAGQLLGTPQYLAPEYIEDHTVTPALDVYQMGLILVELLTGEPVVGGNPMRCVVRHSKGDLTIPAELEACMGSLLRRALHRDHTQRFPDAWAFMEALEALPPASIPDLARRKKGSSTPHTSQGMDSMMQFGDPATLDSAELDALPFGVPPELEPRPVTQESLAPVRMLGTPKPRRGRVPSQPSLPAVHLEEPRTPARGNAALLAALALLLLVGGALAWSFSHKEAEPQHIMGQVAHSPDTPEPEPGPSLGDQVATIDAEPVASVFLGDTRLGPTPHIMFRPAQTSITELTLRREGYQEQPVVLRWEEIKSGAVFSHKLRALEGASPTPTQAAVPALEATREPLLVSGLAVVEGALGLEVVKEALRQHHSDLLECYGRRLRQQDGLAGDLKLLLTVSGQGKVTYAAVQPGALRDVPLENCLVAQARGWSFPEQLDAQPGDTTTQVSLPLVFSSR